MDPRAHYLQGFACGAVVFFGGFFAFALGAFVPFYGEAPVLLRLCDRYGVPIGLGFFGLFFAIGGLSVGGAELTRWAFRRWVPAQCPQCGGQAYGRATTPVTYVCRRCGHTHDTGIREGVEP
jgi:hypothetical protein